MAYDDKQYGVIQTPWTGGADPDPPEPFTPVQRRTFRVTWVMDDDMSAVMGFNVALTPVGATPVNSSIRTVTVDKPEARNAVFAEIPEGDYEAWVQAYGEGSDGQWVSSGTLTVPDDGVPTIRGSDDRNIAAYAEDFENTTAPVGFAPVNATADYSNSKQVVLTPIHNSNLVSYNWNVTQWVNEYLPDIADNGAKRNGMVGMILKIKSSATPVGGAMTVQLGGVYSSFQFISDGAFHVYRVPLAVLNLDSGFDQFFALHTNITGTANQITIEAVALAFQNIDSDLDGKIDKGIKARDRFDRTAQGGYNLITPVRLPGTDDDWTVTVDSNGILWLRDSSGNLISETGYKRGRSYVAKELFAGRERFTWGSSAGDAGGEILPTPDTPVGVNKLRFALNHDSGRDVSGWAVFDGWYRADVVAIHDIDSSGFTISTLFVFAREGYETFHSVQGPWTPSNQAKSSLTFHPTASSDLNPAYDAWYRVDDDFVPTGDSLKLLSCMVILNIQMPLIEKPNGSYYWIDLGFTAYKGADNQTVDHIDIISQAATKTLSNVPARVLTDGQVWRVPLLFGPDDIEGLWNQNIGLNYNYRLSEDGITTGWPTSVSIEQIDWKFVEGITDPAEPLNSEIIFHDMDGYVQIMMLEEF